MLTLDYFTPKTHPIVSCSPNPKRSRRASVFGVDRRYFDDKICDYTPPRDKRMASTVQNHVVRHLAGSSHHGLLLSLNQPAKCRNMKTFYQWHSMLKKNCFHKQRFKHEPNSFHYQFQITFTMNQILCYISFYCKSQVNIKPKIFKCKRNLTIMQERPLAKDFQESATGYRVFLNRHILN